MSEEDWRVKTYYDKRILVPVADVLDSTFPDSLLCLTGGELNLLRNVIDYANRRSTWVSEYRTNDYLGPDNDEWDAIQAFVSELEEKLMNCEEFTQLLEDTLAAAQCACYSSSKVPWTGDLPTEGNEADAFNYGSLLDDEELSEAEEDACAVAQCWYQIGYEVITEQVLPATRFGFDYLVPAVAALIATFVGGPLAGIGVYVTAEFIQEMIEILYNGAETNLINWMEANKQELVCAMWAELLSTANASTMFQNVYDAIVDAAEDISAGDKLIVRLWMGQTALINASRAWVNQTEQAIAAVTAGYCDDCEEPLGDCESRFPPCPNGWTLAFGADCSVEGWLRLGSSYDEAIGPACFSDVGVFDFHAVFNMKSTAPPGVQTCFLNLQGSPDGVSGWVNIHNWDFNVAVQDQWHEYTTPTWLDYDTSTYPYQRLVFKHGSHTKVDVFDNIEIFAEPS